MFDGFAAFKIVCIHLSEVRIALEKNITSNGDSFEFMDRFNFYMSE